MPLEKVKEYYTNDIVYKFNRNKKIVFGLVTESYEGMNDDLDDSTSLQKGQIRVSWGNCSQDKICNQNKVRLMNRSILPGDIIRRLDNEKESQKGYCKEVKQTVTVQIVGTDKVIEHVTGDRLRKVKSYHEEDIITFGNRYGRIDNIEETITMQSKDGSIVELMTGLNELDDYWLFKQNRLTFDPYYVGQEVICVPRLFNQANWIKKTKNMKRNIHHRQRFTIQNIKKVIIEAELYGSPTEYVELYELTPEDLGQVKVLEHPNDSCFDLNERKLLKLKSSDILLKKKDWFKKMSQIFRTDKIRPVVSCNSKIGSHSSRLRSSISLLSPTSPLVNNTPPVYPNVEEGDDDWWTVESGESDGYAEDGECSKQSSTIVENGSTIKEKHYPPKAKELAPGHSLAVEVICIESKVTIVWQDGNEEKDIPSTHLSFSTSIDDHEFFPGEWVISDDKDGTKEKVGVVQFVNYVERTATVKWFHEKENNKDPEVLKIEEVSVYDFQKHAKFAFRPGSIVKNKSPDTLKIGKVIDSFKEGYVLIEWIDKECESCWPHDIELLPDSSECESSTWDSNSQDDKISWETESAGDSVADLSDEILLQSIAAKLDFVRSRIVYLKEAFRTHTISEDIGFLRDLLNVYDNSSYLDKLLGTSFFSVKSKHFLALLMQVREIAKSQNVDIRSRLLPVNYSTEITSPLNVNKIKAAETDNIKKIVKLENRVNQEIEKLDSNKDTNLTTPDTKENRIPQENLCVELLSTLKIRMDLVYAEVISRIGGAQALTVLTRATEKEIPQSDSTPFTNYAETSKDLLKVTTFDKNPGEVDGEGELDVAPSDDDEWYGILDEVPITHNYYSTKMEPTNLQKFTKAVLKEHKLLKESLPPNVWVRLYNNRMDLLSVMIGGPEKTPYEDGLFLFDIKLSPDYPRSPPLVHYISYAMERLNPNLYVEGKVCVSLLGTWLGNGTEMWSSNSTLLQLIVSIQGLILVAEPYYNEAGFEKQANTQQGCENSKTYNELVILKLVQSMTALCTDSSTVFKKEIQRHFRKNGEKLCQRLEAYCRDKNPLIPEFSLLPVSKGLKISLANAINAFRDVLKIHVQDNSKK